MYVSFFHSLKHTCLPPTIGKGHPRHRVSLLRTPVGFGMHVRVYKPLSGDLATPKLLNLPLRSPFSPCPLDGWKRLWPVEHCESNGSTACGGAHAPGSASVLLPPVTVRLTHPTLAPGGTNMGGPAAVH